MARPAFPVAAMLPALASALRSVTSEFVALLAGKLAGLDQVAKFTRICGATSANDCSLSNCSHCEMRECMTATGRSRSAAQRGTVSGPLKVRYPH